MTAEAPALVRTFTVGKRTCIVSMRRPQAGTVSCTVVEWSPTVPTRLTAQEMRQYRAGRDAAFSEMAEALGLRVMVAEL